MCSVWCFSHGDEAGDFALSPSKTVCAFDAVAPPVCGVGVVPAEWVASVFDWDDLVQNVAVWVWVAEAVVDGLPADVASFACCLVSGSQFVSGVAVLSSWIVIHEQPCFVKRLRRESNPRIHAAARKRIQ